MERNETICVPNAATTLFTIGKTESEKRNLKGVRKVKSVCKKIIPSKSGTYPLVVDDKMQGKENSASEALQKQTNELLDARVGSDTFNTMRNSSQLLKGIERKTPSASTISEVSGNHLPRTGQLTQEKKNLIHEEAKAREKQNSTKQCGGNQLELSSGSKVTDLPKGKMAGMENINSKAREGGNYIEESIEKNLIELSSGSKVTNISKENIRGMTNIDGKAQDIVNSPEVNVGQDLLELSKGITGKDALEENKASLTKVEVEKNNVQISAERNVQQETQELSSKVTDAAKGKRTKIENVEAKSRDSENSTGKGEEIKLELSSKVSGMANGINPKMTNGEVKSKDTEISTKESDGKKSSELSVKVKDNEPGMTNEEVKVKDNENTTELNVEQEQQELSSGSKVITGPKENEPGMTNVEVRVRVNENCPAAIVGKQTVEFLSGSYVTNVLEETRVGMINAEGKENCTEEIVEHKAVELSSENNVINDLEAIMAGIENIEEKKKDTENSPEQNFEEKPLESSRGCKITGTPYKNRAGLTIGLMKSKDIENSIQVNIWNSPLKLSTGIIVTDASKEYKTKMTNVQEKIKGFENSTEESVEEIPVELSSENKVTDGLKKIGREITNGEGKTDDTETSAEESIGKFRIELSRGSKGIDVIKEITIEMTDAELKTKYIKNSTEEKVELKLVDLSSGSKEREIPEGDEFSISAKSDNGMANQPVIETIEDSESKMPISLAISVSKVSDVQLRNIHPSNNILKKCSKICSFVENQKKSKGKSTEETVEASKHSIQSDEDSEGPEEGVICTEFRTSDNKGWEKFDNEAIEFNKPTKIKMSRNSNEVCNGKNKGVREICGSYGRNIICKEKKKKTVKPMKNTKRSKQLEGEDSLPFQNKCDELTFRSGEYLNFDLENIQFAGSRAFNRAPETFIRTKIKSNKKANCNDLHSTANSKAATDTFTFKGMRNINKTIEIIPEPDFPNKNEIRGLEKQLADKSDNPPTIPRQQIGCFENFSDEIFTPIPIGVSHDVSNAVKSEGQTVAERIISPPLSHEETPNVAVPEDCINMNNSRKSDTTVEEQKDLPALPHEGVSSNHINSKVSEHIQSIEAVATPDITCACVTGTASLSASTGTHGCTPITEVPSTTIFNQCATVTPEGRMKEICANEENSTQCEGDLSASLGKLAVVNIASNISNETVTGSIEGRNCALTSKAENFGTSKSGTDRKITNERRGESKKYMESVFIGDVITDDLLQGKLETESNEFSATHGQVNPPPKFLRGSGKPPQETVDVSEDQSTYLEHESEDSSPGHESVNNRASEEIDTHTEAKNVISTGKFRESDACRDSIDNEDLRDPDIRDQDIRNTSGYDGNTLNEFSEGKKLYLRQGSFEYACKINENSEINFTFESCKSTSENKSGRRKYHFKFLKK